MKPYSGLFYGERAVSDEIQRSLGRIEGKLDSIIDIQKEHASRLDDLDALKNKGYGILSTVGLVAGTIGAFANKALAAILHSGQP